MSVVFSLPHKWSMIDQHSHSHRFDHENISMAILKIFLWPFAWEAMIQIEEFKYLDFVVSD